MIKDVDFQINFQVDWLCPCLLKIHPRDCVLFIRVLLESIVIILNNVYAIQYTR